MSELTTKLTNQLASRIRRAGNGDHEAAEIVAETIKLLIDATLLEHDELLQQKLQAAIPANSQNSASG